MPKKKFQACSARYVSVCAVSGISHFFRTLDGLVLPSYMLGGSGGEGLGKDLQGKVSRRICRKGFREDLEGRV